MRLYGKITVSGTMYTDRRLYVYASADCGSSAMTDDPGLAFTTVTDELEGSESNALNVFTRLAARFSPSDSKPRYNCMIPGDLIRWIPQTLMISFRVTM
jgi:hypothetical protein